MEYQKIVNSLDDTSNKLSKFTTRNWAEINDASRLTYILIMALNLKLQW